MTMERYEYIQMPLALLREEIVEQYKSTTVAKDGWVYAEILRGMCGLKQAGRIENKYPTKNIGPHGYYQFRHTHGLWLHKWRPIKFSLVVYDFGVKYVGNKHANHLIETIKKYYPLSVDWTGGLYCGVTLKWN